jgi:hypothetical protein
MPAHPAHQLYDGACELLAAAQELRVAAHRRGCEEAITATLSCMGAAVEELNIAMDALGDDLWEAGAAPAVRPVAVTHAFHRLTEELLCAARASDDARAKAACAHQLANSKRGDDPRGELRRAAALD